jgi:hypothetical protein
MRGIVAGAFALIVLQVLVTNTRAANALGGVAVGAGKAVHWFLDPNTPAIPDRSSNANTAAAVTPAGSSTSSPQQPLTKTLDTTPGSAANPFLPGVV